MTSFRATDCQGFAGGMTLGVVQAGFELQGKVEMEAGFGVEPCLENGHLLSGLDETKVQVRSAEDWEPFGDVELLFGNPPCSGFSQANTALAKYGDKASITRGADSPINDCMYALVGYAGRHKTPPPFVVFESVQGAFTIGRELMRSLRTYLEYITGVSYDLTHVKMNVLSVGGVQDRRRYFFVAHRQPFYPALPHPDERHVPTIQEAICDLAPLKLTRDSQHSPMRASKWTLREGLKRTSVEDHWAHESGMIYEDTMALVTAGWPAGMKMSEVMELHPDALTEERQARWSRTFNTPRRPEGDRVAYTLVGDSLNFQLHYSKPRFYTVREAARLSGYPDDWTFRAATNPVMAGRWMAKGLCVQAGRWIGEQVQRSLTYDGAVPEIEVPAETIGDREHLVDITNVWKAW